MSGYAWLEQIEADAVVMSLVELEVAWICHFKSG